MEQVELQEQMDLQVLQVQVVQTVHQELQDQMVLQVLMAHQVLQELQALQV